jgi:hypothetical protein
MSEWQIDSSQSKMCSNRCGQSQIMLAFSFGKLAVHINRQCILATLQDLLEASFDASLLQPKSCSGKQWRRSAGFDVGIYVPIIGVCLVNQMLGSASRNVSFQGAQLMTRKWKSALDVKKD